MAQNAAAFNWRSLSGLGLGVPLLALVVLAMMVIPLPPLVLDLLFSFNISVTLIILLATLYAKRPLDLASFPTLLLITTLLRLALNVASTRLILLHGQQGPQAAGHVIESFGQFVIGGNYAVGMVVFLILTIINFVVVTRGAGRVSEVSARFTLDAMPGKQMAIDADLSAGLLSQEEARRRREEVREEADFYGAMDGASKFVRGDAIAGILVVVINILGGLLIGTMQHHLALADAARTYTMLTIGDGLVAQIPALVLSVATGILVTRVSQVQDVSQEIVSQIFRNPRPIFYTAGLLGFMGVLPGMPNTAFLSLAALCVMVGYAMWRRSQQQEAAAEAPATPAPISEDMAWEGMVPVSPLQLEIGHRLIPLVDKQQGGQLLLRIREARRSIGEEVGFIIPPINVYDRLREERGDENRYRVLLHGVLIGEGVVYPDRMLAAALGPVFGDLQGEHTKDIFGKDAVWIEPAERTRALTVGYEVVDAEAVIVMHLRQLLRRHAADLLGQEEVQKLLDVLARRAPKLVESLTPKPLSLVVIWQVLRNLLQEQIPIVDMRSICEALSVAAIKTQDVDILTDKARESLGPLLIQGIYGKRTEIAVATLDPQLEQLLLRLAQNEAGAVLDPSLASHIRQSINQVADKQSQIGEPVAMLVAPPLRRLIARMARSATKALPVLSYNELPDERQVRVIATVGGALEAGS